MEWSSFDLMALSDRYLLFYFTTYPLSSKKTERLAGNPPTIDE
jgi:hypothetical protein